MDRTFPPFQTREFVADQTYDTGWVGNPTPNMYQCEQGFDAEIDLVTVYGYGPSDYHPVPSYQTRTGPVEVHDANYDFSRSGSFSSASSAESGSSYASSDFSDYMGLGEMVYLEPVYPQFPTEGQMQYVNIYPNQNQSPSSYNVGHSPMSHVPLADPALSCGAGNGFIDSLPPAFALPDPMFEFPCQPPHLAPPHSVPLIPIPYATPQNIYDQPSHFAIPPTEWYPSQAHHYMQEVPLPLHQPRPIRLNETPSHVDAFSIPPLLPSHSLPVRMPPSQPIDDPRYSPTPGLIEETGDISGTRPIFSIPLVPAPKDDIGNDMVPINTLIGLSRQPWPGKYESQVFTAEDMKLPAVKRRRIYINSLEQACNQIHALLKVYGLECPPNPEPKPSYLPRAAKSRDNKLAVVKAQYETTLLHERIDYLTEIENRAQAEARIVHHPHSNSILT